MLVKDRAQAAQELATALAAYRGKHPLILAIGAVDESGWVYRADCAARYAAQIAGQGGSHRVPVSARGFCAVGYFYVEFPQVDDAEMAATLAATGF